MGSVTPLQAADELCRIIFDGIIRSYERESRREGDRTELQGNTKFGSTPPRSQRGSSQRNDEGPAVVPATLEMRATPVQAVDNEQPGVSTEHQGNREPGSITRHSERSGSTQQSSSQHSDEIPPEVMRCEHSHSEYKQPTETGY